MKYLSSLKQNKYHYAMVLCFLYSGISLMLFILQIYTIFWRNEPTFFERPFMGGPGRMPQMENPLSRLFLLHNVVMLIGAITALIAGLAIWNLTRKKEVQKAKEVVLSALLTPQEKGVVKLLNAHEDGLTQSNLVRETGYTKVQVHRIVKKLESQGLLEKHKYGLTNKILIHRDYANGETK